ncbi:hypothetical protein BDV96DRAFT_643713 [Lophiotrema nucula]|uniref:DUF726-domain-containing protein n=1 Tax=Lophiotrema nucula TaxID=690887 RepID=A0A6A5ZI18_9PLEO|nr:hypothetical protein BDV96DRAFT_643713 [Lophiotrema nucula]
MTTEPAPEAPIAASKAPANAQAPTKTPAKPDVEYDDFGLPMRKARPKTPLPEGSDSDEDVFADAVASKSASQEKVPLPATSGSAPKKAQEKLPGEPGYKVSDKIARIENRVRSESIVNGHDEEADNSEVKEEDEKPAGTKAETPPEATDTPELKEEAEKPVDDNTEPAEPEEEKFVLQDAADRPREPQGEPSGTRQRADTTKSRNSQGYFASEFSHQQLAPHKQDEEKEDEDLGWQTMPAYARWDMYDDDNKLVAKENEEELQDLSGYANVGGAAKGYTRVTTDDDAQSQTSMDDHTAYLFKESQGTALLEDDDEAARDPLTQMQTTKNLLTEGQRIAYVGLVRLAIMELTKQPTELERNKNTKKLIDLTQEQMQMWSQKMMLRLYAHMEVDTSEQIMIEQLAEHGVIAADMTPILMQNARVKNPAVEEEDSARPSIASPKPDDEQEDDLARQSISSPKPEAVAEKSKSMSSLNLPDVPDTPPPPPYEEHEGEDLPAVRMPSQLPQTQNIDIDLRWTILCDLFLVLIADSVYDSRSRQLLEQVGKSLSVDWLDICRFEKRVTEALEMQEEANKENWNEDDHVESRRKRARNRRLALMGLATVGGSLVIGLSAGLLAPVIGAGLAAGFTTIGVAGTSGFLAGAGGAAIITTTGVVSGGTIAVRAANRRTGSVKTFEYRPLHNNKRVNLIVTVAGWMNGKVDDVRLPYSTIDPIMGDIYSIHWEPEMLRSMGDTINILATEALTQGLQQVLGSTILIALMAAIQLPVALTKLAYLIDNPWTVSQARADMAGLILADSLIDRNLGTRPITLVGFSLGARVIFSCLKELASRGAYGIVQNVYMFGLPAVAKKDDFIKMRAIIPGRFVNGYATNDWILGYLFRATSGGIMRVAGLAPINEVPGIENFNVTELVPGHMAYRAAMPKLMREVGWIVECDEFAEIEDPDPENHEARQRELINEIEDARKELEKKQEKKGFSFWRKKKQTKKDWEVYDENSQKGGLKDADGNPIESPVMFDIDAIRAEVAALAAEGMEPIEIKEIKSTLPPMKIDLSQTSPLLHSGLRETKSYNDSLGPSTAINGDRSNNPSRSPSPQPQKAPSRKQSSDNNDAHADGDMGMAFDSSFKEPPKPASNLPASIPTPPPTSSSAPPAAPIERPPLKPHATEPNIAPGYNAWADELEDEFKEKEVQMTFE